ERQDAMYKLVDEKLDLMLVVGTQATLYIYRRLQRNVEFPHIGLKHGELVEQENFLPDGPITIGMTSGASTPYKLTLLKLLI
ncbi:hypothetical protein FXO38_06898, partial [Capsicum annuum]